MPWRSPVQLLAEVAGEVDPAAASIERNVDRMLAAVRNHLGMDVAFVSEFQAEDRIFRNVDSSLEHPPVAVGDRRPLSEGYCLEVVEGRIPELIPDTTAVPALAHIADTRATPIGAHISVPIRLQDGSVYGTLCCFSFAASESLNLRDLQMMRAFAELLAYQIEGDLKVMRAHEEKVERIRAVLEVGQPSIVYQPIFNIASRRIVGVECLSRFHLPPTRTPDVWFGEAHELGLGVRLELNAILTALEGLRRFPGDFYVSLNVSPQTIVSGDILGYLDAVPAQRLVLEVTEHSHVADYRPLQQQLGLLRAEGVRIAVDDAGAGYASMRHVLALQPDIIKLDMSLTRGIDGDSPQRALAAALIEFARHIRSGVVAEGVETAGELYALQSLGVDDVQGYLMSRPLGPEALLALLQPIQD